MSTVPRFRTDLDAPASYEDRASAAPRTGRLGVLLALTMFVSASVFVSASAPASASATTATSAHHRAVFTGDATGRKDVTASLRRFLQRHDGQHVALARNGRYKVSQLSFSASRLTVDFRGARILGTRKGAHGILRIQSSSHIVLNYPKVYGTGYTWDPSNQQEHGIQIDGGSDITLNHPLIRDTRGDGIYVAFQAGKNRPPVRVVINHPNIKRASRNGIAPVAGDVTIRGGRIRHTGLHGIDFEVNDDRSAASIRAVVDGVDIRHHGDLRAARSHCTCYAVAAGGYSTATKPSLVVQDLTGDNLRMTIRHTASVVVRNNVSRLRTTARFPGSQAVTFKGNTRITRQ